MDVKEIVITSSNAPNKNPDPESKVGVKVIQDRVDALERIFYQRISEGRGVSTEDIKENFGRGGLLVSFDPDPNKPDAVSVKMIDSVIGVNSNIKGTNMNYKALSEEQMKKVVAVLNGNYPQGIKALAEKVLIGEGDYNSLSMAAALQEVHAPGGIGHQQAAAQAAARLEAEKKFTDEVNADRAKAGLPPLSETPATVGADNGNGLISGPDELQQAIAAGRRQMGLN